MIAAKQRRKVVTLLSPASSSSSPSFSHRFLPFTQALLPVLMRLISSNFSHFFFPLFCLYFGLRWRSSSESSLSCLNTPFPSFTLSSSPCSALLLVVMLLPLGPLLVRASKTVTLGSDVTQNHLFVSAVGCTLALWESAWVGESEPHLRPSYSSWSQLVECAHECFLSLSSSNLKIFHKM